MRRPASTLARAALAMAAAGCDREPTRVAPPPALGFARDIGDSTTVFGWAEDVNASGQVVGWRLASDGDLYYTAFLWIDGHGMTNLGRLPGTAGHAMAGAINDRGDVVGISDDRPDLWTASGGMRDLGTLPGAAAEYSTAQAASVNRFGQAVGTVRASSSPRPVLFVTKPGR